MKTLRIIFLFVITIIALRLNAQEDQIEIMMKDFDQPNAFGLMDERYLTSKETNSTYLIKIYMPTTYSNAQKKYPVLVLTDASLFMGIAQTTFDCLTLTHEIPDIIIVGISYQYSGILEWVQNRFRDMTPTHDEGFNPSGSASKSIAFIKNELYPYIENNYRIDTTNRCFYGHSLGGLLGSHILIEHPELFNHYIIGSPSYWWDNKEITKRLTGRNYLLSNNIKTIYTFIGGEEDVHVNNWKEFNEILLTKLDKSVKFSQKVYENETHVSVPLASFSTAIKFVYKK